MRASPDPNGVFQSRVSVALAALRAAPAVHETLVTDTGNWIIMDRILPGTRLRDVNVSADTPTSLANILRPLNGEPAPSSEMPPISDWLESRLIDDQLTDLAPGRTVASSQERQDALEILEDLRSDGVTGLCHADSSPGNILLGDAQFWLIDPRGMSGEIAYDVAVIALKAAQYVPPMIGAAHLAELVGVDRERTQAWVHVAGAARV
jgi:streptomycin 6-kinase